MPKLAEERRVHTRLVACALQVEDSRAYWQHADPDGVRPTARRAFDAYWFGARSLARTQVLLANLRARFDAFPAALRVLHAWTDMTPETRRTVCHWHLQLTDPLYRWFAGDYLVERHRAERPHARRDLVVEWIEGQAPGRWSVATRMKLASKLLSAAHEAGLVGSVRDPRPLTYPRVLDHALAYLMYLLRGVAFEGTLLDNPYLRSLGLQGLELEARLRALPGLGFRRQGHLVDFEWSYPDLEAWAAAELFASAPAARAAAGGLG
jgi:hypothetical protein